MTEIYSGIPVPKSTRGGNNTAKYPTRTMQVGENYYLIPEGDETIELMMKRANGQIQSARKDNKALKFAARITTHHATGVACVGVWRVA